MSTAAPRRELKRPLVRDIRNPDRGTRQPLIERWDGRRWHVVRTPTARTGALYDVDAASGADASAVGEPGVLRFSCA
jgi:hypothetical protein